MQWPSRVAREVQGFKQRGCQLTMAAKIRYRANSRRRTEPDMNADWQDSEDFASLPILQRHHGGNSRSEAGAFAATIIVTTISINVTFSLFCYYSYSCHEH